MIKYICTIIFLFSISTPQAQIFKNNFDHFTEENGLPSNNVNAILQDHLGYIWIGTNNGLSRFDGYEFVNFSPVPNDTNFLQLPLISSLYEDSNGDIWIGAIGGLTKYSRESNTFKLYSLFEIEKKEERSFAITSICETKNGDILFSVADLYYRNFQNGLYLLDRKSSIINVVEIINADSTNALFQISRIGDDKYYISGVKGIFEFDLKDYSIKWFPLGKEIVVASFLPDINNTLWLGTINNGLIKYNIKDSTYNKFPIFNNLDYNGDFFGIFRIIFDQENNLLFTTNKGLIHFDRENKNISISEVDPLNPSALHSSNLESIIQDQSGSIWITSNDAGISKYNLVKHDFRSYTPKLNDPNSITPGWINSIFEYNNNELWFNSASGGITRFDRQKEIFRRYTLPGNFEVFGIMKNSRGQILLAGSNGIYQVDADKWKFERLKIPFEMNENVTFTVCEVNKNAYWIGTYKGLYIYDYLNGSSAKIDFQSLGIGTVASNQIHSIIQDKGKNIWIGADDGLFKYDNLTKTYYRVGFSEEPSKSLNTQDVNAIYEDVFGNLWIGTWLGGLNRYDPETGTFESFSQKDGLKSPSVQGILGDEENGALWVSTFEGISRFDLENKKFSNFGIDDGIQGNQFADGSALKTSTGDFIFGGQNGVTIFNSNDIQNNLIPPKVLVTDFKLFNVSIKNGNNSPLKKPIYETKKITLSYDENDISFDYLAFHYVNPKKNQYAYRLENYEDDWRYVGSQRTAIYPNLPPGDYIFHLKASNNNEIWNEEGVSIEIEILPPWWQTIWAYTGYALIFILGIFALDRIQRRRLLAKERAASAMKEVELRAVAAEAQAKVIQAENDRKTEELEEARQLQLSMLPKTLPQLPHLDIAVYMKTATEVGGDYYDFHLAMDGTLTVVLGDATGHGMKAGTMVTTTKSLFNTLAPNPDIVNTFHEMTRCLKLMQFDKLFMCLTMLKITNNKLQLSSAGMPPVFIFRNHDKTVEEYLAAGLPLGTITDFPYEIKETEIVSGDSVLIMSDGFPELMNENKELYGYKRVKNKFEEIAEKEPGDIISLLKDEGEKWLNGEEPDDDVTFVVIKVK